MQPVSVILLGEATTGKTSIVSRLVKDTFRNQTDATIGAAFIIGTFEGKKYNFWDTAGQERFLSLTPMYYRKGEIIILTFDTSRLYTVDRIVYYLEKIKADLKHKFEVIIVGTKTDLLKTSISYVDSFVKEKLGEFDDIIKENDYIYISSKTATNTDKLLELLKKKGEIIRSERCDYKSEDDGIVTMDDSDSSKKSFLSKITFGYCV